MKRPDAAIARVASHLGIDVDERQLAQLERFASWLVDEAATLGGIGPSEAERVWDRHVLDALLFATGLSPTNTVLDVGTGVGLPGLPVAIVHGGPVTLLDRSGRRVDAVRRIVSILGIDVTIAQRDIATWDQRHDRVLFRASLPLAAARANLHRLCTPGGHAVFGIGRGDAPEALDAWRRGEAPDSVDETLLEVSGVLDSPAWLLRMTPL